MAVAIFFGFAIAQPLLTPTPLEEVGEVKGDGKSYRESIEPVAALNEMRFCGEPRRNPGGEITRKSSVRTAFRKWHHCPVTGQLTGPCNGWEIDHVIPLECGGCDAVSNMQWLPIALKQGPNGKDSFERVIYCSPIQRVKVPPASK